MDDADATLAESAMFPLGSVLLPHMPLPLRLFEERYLRMLGSLLETDDPSFGVVLIERGQEVGGGDKRFDVGTLALVTEVAGSDEGILIDTVGTDRFVVEEWLEDAPYPLARLRLIDEFVWDESLTDLRDRTEAAVRRALAVGSEYGEQRFAAVVELSDDPIQHCWQLAGIAPVGDLDQIDFLKAETLEELLETVRDRATSAAEAFRDGWS